MLKKILSLLLIFCITVLAPACRTTPTPTPPPQTGEPSPTPQQPDDTNMVAAKLSSAPKIDGTPDELWNNISDISINLTGGGLLQGSGGKFDDGKTVATGKAAYDNENIYMLWQWKDPDESIARGPWIKEGEKLVKKPYSTHYEDKFALIWNINDSIKGFETQGCGVTCHDTDLNDPVSGKILYKHWTNGDTELADMWHMKLVRQNTLFGASEPGLMHDQYMDSVQYDPNKAKETKGAGRHSDPGAKEYEDNITGESNDAPGNPKVVLDGAPVNGNPYVIVEGVDKTKPFDPTIVASMKEGDFIPGLISKQLTGDPADIKVKMKFDSAQKIWTLELQRSFKTNSNFDVQFDDLAKTYWFSVAAFDNSQIGHATNTAPVKLTFQQ